MKKVPINLSELLEIEHDLSRDLKLIKEEYDNETDKFKKDWFKINYATYQMMLTNVKKLIKKNG